MKAIHLQTNHLFNPIGIDTVPIFSWSCEGGKRQSAYQIVVKNKDVIYWDSGKVLSNKMNAIKYEGKQLNSREQLNWYITLWDENDNKDEEVNALFEMGLLNKEDWKANWIKGNYKANKKVRYPVDCFKKEFVVEDNNKARLYVSARGLYDCFINGKRIEEYILAPGITDYRKRIQYQTYDISNLLIKGNNTLELRLADGWYRGSSAAYGVTHVYGNETAIIAQLEIDGKVVVKSDETFKWSNDGPIRFSDLKDGEIIDNNLVPSYSNNALIDKKDSNLVSSNNVYVKEKERFKAKLIKKENNKYVFDFGQNIAGYISFNINAHKGQKIEITCGETLDKNNDVDLKGIQIRKPIKGWNELTMVMAMLGNEPKKDYVMTPLQKISYTCKEGINEYKTSFAIFGFKYIEVISDIEINEDMFESIAVYSDMEETGNFNCSNELINKFVSNVRWSMKSNFLDIPTDCPTRERLGWSGDAQIFFNSGSYLMDISSFFSKWLIDMEDAQMKNGVIPAVFPYEGAQRMYDATGTSVGWADAVYLIPYRYYKKYNDINVLENSWPMIKKYVDYLFNNLGFKDKKEAKNNPDINKYVYEKGVHLGEWLEPEEFRDKVYGTQAKHPEECTAYLHLTMKIVGEIADILGHKEYVTKCKEYEEGSKDAYNKLFVDNENIITNRQAKLVRPLALGLLDGKTKENVQKQLKKAIEEYDYCVGTGFLSTPFILPVLQDAGEVELAYKVLENQKAPGWLSEVKAGATTIWENWEGDNSLNHYSPGAAIEWLFTSVLGINIEPNNHITLRPQFSNTLTNVNGEYRSIYGDIKVKWYQKDNKYIYEVIIPSNASANLIMPNGELKELECGENIITC